MTPYYEHGGIAIYHGDCRDVMPILSGVDVVVTDPPYPDYHVEAYGYDPLAIELLRQFECRQLVFWSARAEFPLSHSAIHVWDKECPGGVAYERIFERNGGSRCCVFRHQFVNNRTLARFHRDEWTGHPSQKPQALMRALVEFVSKEGDCVVDPFCGSGSTLKAAQRLGRRAVGIEREEKYCEIAARRLAQGALRWLEGDDAASLRM